jgi:hypothetical protein
MTEPTLFPVLQLGAFPATRVLGREGRGRLEDLLAGKQHFDLTIDFTSVTAMTISFADEFLGKFLSTFDTEAQDATVKLTGLNPENLEAVSICLERRGSQVVVRDPDGSLSLMGDDILAGTFEEARKQPGSFKASDIAGALSLSAQNANNRLKRLVAAGALRKGRATGSRRGGKEYAYEAVTAELPDAETLSNV